MTNRVISAIYIPKINCNLQSIKVEKVKLLALNVSARICVDLIEVYVFMSYLFRLLRIKFSILAMIRNRMCDS